MVDLTLGVQEEAFPVRRAKEAFLIGAVLVRPRSGRTLLSVLRNRWLEPRRYHPYPGQAAAVSANGMVSGPGAAAASVEASRDRMVSILRRIRARALEPAPPASPD